jgi:putative endopeptidase
MKRRAPVFGPPLAVPPRPLPMTFIPALPWKRLTTLAAALALASLWLPGAALGQAQSAPTVFDVTGMDAAVKPGNDFYGYANGGWMKATEIPADQASWSIFHLLAEKVLKETRALLDEAVQQNAPAGSDTRKAADYYASFRDEAAIEARGLAPVKPALAHIAAVKNATALARLLGEQLRADVDPVNATNLWTTRLFGLFVSPDFNEPTHNVGYLL